MSIVGRRGSRGPGWTWSRQPSGSRRPPPSLPPLPLAGAGLIALFVALALLGLWLSDWNDNSPVGGGGTPTPTPAATATPSPSPTATPVPVLSPTPSPSPVPTPTSPTPDSQGPLFRLAAWDGERWRFEERPEGAAFRTGEAVPFLLRINRASRGDAYSLTIRYDCEAFALLTSYDRDHDSRPALTSAGPESAAADTTVSLPYDPGPGTDDGEAGSLSLWGGSFTGVYGPLPSSTCSGEKSLTVGLAATADTLYLMWAAEITLGAAERDTPLRLAVRAPDAEELSIEIDPDSVGPAQP